jgi:hypothetical protein
MKIDNKKCGHVIVVGFLSAVILLSSSFTAYAMNNGELPFNADDELRRAIGENDLAGAQRALELGAKPREGLACAIGLKGTDAAMLDPMMDLLDKDGLSSIDDNGTALLHLAAKSGDIKAAEKLLDKGVEIDALNATGRTPLMFAVFFKQAAMVQWLLEHAADITKTVSVEEFDLPILWWTEELAKKDESYNAVLICLKAFQATQNTDRFDRPASGLASGLGNNINNKPATGSKAPKLSAEKSFFKHPLVYALLGVVVAGILYKFSKSTKVSSKR